ncbi:MAG: helix-turn-helix domain-containing protein [Prevotellaceae bacterium]|jgi:DNA-directed RNA polymerase specialized sigma24 family protein|nr:helix-turn-helix domain-containing protein [Prevotellaceae bacterium]
MKKTSKEIKATIKVLNKELETELHKEKRAEKIKRYFTIGLTYVEIGKLLDVSSRTIQRYITANEVKKEVIEPKALQKKAFELSAKGFSYAEIAAKLRVTKTTVYNWHRKRKQAAPPEK